jgi:peptidoglycan-associated lipoprotein
MRLPILISLMLVGALVAGCGSAEKKPDVQDQSVGADGATTAGAGGPSAASGQLLDPQAQAEKDRAALIGQRRIHFAFDSSAIDDNSRRVVEVHAAEIVKNPNAKVVLEGHGDERGSREYNLALGERRAQAVERMMKVLGVPASRLKTVSYGEEKPLEAAHTEGAWQQNRRVEIQY